MDQVTYEKSSAELNYIISYLRLDERIQTFTHTKVR